MLSCPKRGTACSAVNCQRSHWLMLLILSKHINKILTFPYEEIPSLTLWLANICFLRNITPHQHLIFLPRPPRKKWWLLPGMSSYQKSLKLHKTLRIKMEVREKWAIKINSVDFFSFKTCFLGLPHYHHKSFCKLFPLGSEESRRMGRFQVLSLLERSGFI